MFFVLSKLLSFLLKPLIWIIIGLLFSFFLKNVRWKRFFFALSLSMLLLLTNGFLFQHVVKTWEPDPAVLPVERKPFDYIILLGGYSDFQTALGKSEFQLGGKGGNRLISALRLYREGWGKRILFTGGSGKLTGDKYAEADYVAPYLRTLGIPDTAVILETASRNTRENAVFSRHIVDSLKAGSNCLLLTSAIHMPRSKACFDKAGLETFPYPTDYYSRKEDNPFARFLEPSPETLLAWEALIHEWMGVLIYQIKGYN